MILYHGSNVVVERPKILQSVRMLDFGVGFYTTSNKEQAVRWAEKALAYCCFTGFEKLGGEKSDIS